MMPYRAQYVSPYPPTPFKGQGFIGRTADGGRVYVDVRVTNEIGEHETIEHETINGCTRVAISGRYYEKGARDWTKGGQIVEMAASVVKPAPNVTHEDIARLTDVWRRWHLSDMRPGCAHQTPVWRANPRTGAHEYDLDNTPPCPVTGYKFGRNWLVEQVPDAVLDELWAIVSKLNGEDMKNEFGAKTSHD